MKIRVKVKCEIDKMFDAMTAPVRQGYYDAKKAYPTEDQMAHGLTYTSKVTTGNAKTDKKMGERYATIKVKKYERPNHYSMEYNSSTYHKIDSAELNKIDDIHTEIIYESYSEQIKNGNVIKTMGSVDSDQIKNIGFLEKMRFDRMAADARKSLYELKAETEDTAE